MRRFTLTYAMAMSRMHPGPAGSRDQIADQRASFYMGESGLFG